MGGLLFRSSSDRARRKQKKGNRERLPTSEVSPDDDQYPQEIENDRRISNANTLNTYEKWDQGVNQQNLPTMNVDPPGAPSTFSTNYSSIQQDIMNRSWSSGQNINNPFYQVNPVAAAMISNTSHDLNQFGQMPTSNVFGNQPSQPMNDDRSSKKVQFAQLAPQRPLQQSAAQKKILASTQSWHESSVNMRDKPAPAIKTDSGLLNAQFLHQTSVALPASSLAKVPAPAAVPVPKPIYVGVDHQETLAERGQIVVNKRVRKTAEHSNADESHLNANSHRTRSHAPNQHRHTESNHSPVIKTHVHSNRPVDPLQPRLSGSQRLGTTTTSTSTIIPNKPIAHIHQPTMGDQELRPTKTRGIRQQQSQHVEHQSLVHNELLPSRSKGSHSQKKHQPRPTVMRHDSPSRSEAPVTTRRIEHKPSGSPVMRIPIAQHQQQRQRTSTMPSTATNTTRTRV